jgi:hypothetical protein
VTVTGVDKIRVDLVGHHHEVAFERQLRDALELLAPEDPTGRIVGIAEQDHTGVVVHGGAQGFGVDAGTGRTARERVLDQAPLQRASAAQERRIDRRLDDDAVTGLRELLDRDVHSLDHVGEDLDATGVRQPSEAIVHVTGGDLRHIGRRGMNGVAQVGAIHGEAEHASDGLGDREVHVGDP